MERNMRKGDPYSNLLVVLAAASSVLFTSSLCPATVIPVGIRYSRKAIVKDVTIRFGSPLDVDTQTDFPSIMKTVMSQIMEFSGL